jgi:hypothetical protein
MPQTADRNLLLGILALQTDFVTRDALIAAMLAWSVAKHRPLESILVDQGALDAADRHFSLQVQNGLSLLEVAVGIGEESR